MSKRREKWEFTDQWFISPGLTPVFFETKNEAYVERFQKTDGMILVEPHDRDKIRDKKVMFGNFKSGLFIWKEGRKRYLHRYFLETDGKDLSGLRVGFLDDNPFNLQIRNLFTYEESGRPLLNKWKAKREGLLALEKQGLVRRTTT